MSWYDTDYLKITSILHFYKKQDLYQRLSKPQQKCIIVVNFRQYGTHLSYFNIKFMRNIVKDYQISLKCFRNLQENDTLLC